MEEVQRAALVFYAQAAAEGRPPQRSLRFWPDLDYMGYQKKCLDLVDRKIQFLAEHKAQLQ